MKQVVVNVPEAKLPFLNELFHALGYEAYTQESPVTPAMDAAIQHELQQIEHNPNYLLDWREARKTLKRGNSHA